MRLLSQAVDGAPILRRELADGDTMHAGDDAHYLAVGADALRCIEQALAGRQPRAVLDLPCGFGRVTRILRARFPDARMTVCDLDRPGVDFCAAQFGATGVYSTGDLCQLVIGDRFDLIWVGSLITHVSQDQTLGLLDAMSRVMTPEAVMVVSSHGPSIVPGLRTWCYGLMPPDAAGVLDDYAALGYGHRGYDGGTGYGISLTDQAWWQQASVANGLDMVAYRPEAWDGHQDIVVLRPKPGRHPARHHPDPALAARRRALASHDGRLRLFDQAYYLATYPDVMEGVARGDSESAYQHYLEKGRAEGRRCYPGPLRPAVPPPDLRFDEAWYLGAFPDVASGVADGRIASGYDHWLDCGRVEGRPPHAPGERPT